MDGVNALKFPKMIRVKYYFKEHPQSTLSVFLKTQDQVDAFKLKHPDYVYLTEEKTK
jgi:hypothetical protein